MNKNHSALWRFLPALLAAALTVGVLTVAGACGMKDDGTWMHCHGAQTAAAALGGAVAALALLAALVKGRGARAALYALAVAGSVLLFLLPGTLMPLCMMRTMRCYTVMQPFVRLMAAAVALISGMQAVRALKGV